VHGESGASNSLNHASEYSVVTVKVESMNLRTKSQTMAAMQLIMILIIVHSILGCSPSPKEQKSERSRNEFSNVLNIEGTPAHIHDFDTFFFSDQGAWFGFALPKTQEKVNNGVGFVGPFLLSHGSWLATSYANLEIFESSNGEKFSATETMQVKSSYYPGLIRIESRNESIGVTQDLCFADANTALIRVQIKNLSESSTYIKKDWTGSVWMEEVEISASNSQVTASIKSSSDVYTLKFDENSEYTADKPDTKSYRLSEKKVHLLESGAVYTENVILTYSQMQDRSNKVDTVSGPNLNTYVNNNFTQNESRWNSYVDAILAQETDLLKDPEYQKVAVKALQTLMLNWRAPRGALRHGGLFPSAAVWYFNGFWGWDSWKHVIALSRFAPDIAEDQILTMFDFQDEYGMIADCIYADSTENNWRNTKPPLAAWAVSELYDQSENLEFVKGIYPKLIKYHKWWYVNRDHDQDGLCEYGCTDGTLVAAKWESGVDDGIHYDSSKVVQNNSYAWSLDQESVDLNSYLYLEKIYLARLSDLVGEKQIAKKFRMDADELKLRIQSDMFDLESGFFYDIGIDDKSFIGVYGPQGWIPLWTGVASAKQAIAVREIVLDPQHFSTYIPFPTVSKSNPAYLSGYWRGPVWLDQAFFGISGLRRYGYEEDALRFTKQIIDRSEGLKGAQGPIRENYNPETGEGMKVNHFSWSAAHLLMMLWEM